MHESGGERPKRFKLKIQGSKLKGEVGKKRSSLSVRGSAKKKAKIYGLKLKSQYLWTEKGG